MVRFCWRSNRQDLPKKRAAYPMNIGSYITEIIYINIKEADVEF